MMRFFGVTRFVTVFLMALFATVGISGAQSAQPICEAAPDSDACQQCIGRFEGTNTTQSTVDMICGEMVEMVELPPLACAQAECSLDIGFYEDCIASAIAFNESGEFARLVDRHRELQSLSTVEQCGPDGYPALNARLSEVAEHMQAFDAETDGPRFFQCLAEIRASALEVITAFETAEGSDGRVFSARAWDEASDTLGRVARVSGLVTLHNIFGTGDTVDRRLRLVAADYQFCPD